MSVLLLDAGNTRLKWALCERGHFVQRGAFGYQWSTLSTQLSEQWSTVKSAAVDKLVLCNVAGEQLESALRQWLSNTAWPTGELQEKRPLTIEIVTAQSHAFGVQCGYERPAMLGADRWAALVAARAHIAGVACVIDCGTALTIDVLDAEGVHVGGLIAPGMSMMRQSLSANTAQIDVESEMTQSIFSARDTASAVQAGIMAATAGAVQQVMQQCHDQGLPRPHCVVTGGDAERLLPTLPMGSQYEDEWVLKGLAVIAGC